MAQAAALGGIVGGDVAAVYSQGAVALAHTAAAFGGFVAGNVTAAHQAVAAVYVPAGAIDGLIATDDYILRGMGVAKQQAAAASTYDNQSRNTGSADQFKISSWNIVGKNNAYGTNMIAPYKKVLSTANSAIPI